MLIFGVDRRNLADNLSGGAIKHTQQHYGKTRTTTGLHHKSGWVDAVFRPLDAMPKSDFLPTTASTSRCDSFPRTACGV